MSEPGPTPDLNDPDALIGTVDLARLLGMTDRHARRLYERGEFPRPVRVGRSDIWRMRDVADAIRARLTRGAA